MFLGTLLLTIPTIYAQNYLAKAKEFLEQGDCERARLAYDDYKRHVNPQGDVEVQRRIDECGKITPPTVFTLEPTSISNTSTICGGNVTKDGGASVTERGVCWSTSHYPNINDKYTSNGNGTGRYTSNLSGLKAGTTYYVRAYATNSAGTAYGEEVIFTTKAIDNCGTVTDYDGNVYSTVWIGNQCWMRENLRVTRDCNGKHIVSSKDKEISTSIPYRYYPNNEFGYVSTYGFLYNWNAAMRTCPQGWHLPSDIEWKQLEVAAGMSIYDANKENLRGSIASKISGNRGWESSLEANAAGNFSAPERNKTGFSALPSGMVIPIYGNVRMGKTAAFWCSDSDGDNAWLRMLGSDGAEVGRAKTTKGAGCSVRCVRD